MALVLVLEAARRTIGWHLPVIGLIAIAYAYFADFMPGSVPRPAEGPRRHRREPVPRASTGCSGTPLQVAATFIILFTIYGAILDYTGAGKFYVDLAFAADRHAGRPARRAR